jgi:hypothetical protein
MARSAMRNALAFWLAALAALAAWNAQAGPAGPDAHAVRKVIIAHFQAFADDDADAAYLTATPVVRQQVGHPRHFLALVRGSYPMLYRPASIGFLEIEVKGRRATQSLRVVDADGHAWRVLFRLERQSDGGWRIGGCTVSEAPGQPA